VHLHTSSSQDNHPLVGQFLKILLAATPYDIHMQWHDKWPREPFIRYLAVGNDEQLLINTPEARMYFFRLPTITTKARQITQLTRHWTNRQGGPPNILLFIQEARSSIPLGWRFQWSRSSVPRRRRSQEAEKDFEGYDTCYDTWVVLKETNIGNTETFTLPNLKRIFPVFQTKSKALSSLFGQNLDENGKGVVNSESLYL